MSNRSPQTWPARFRRDWLACYAAAHGAVGRRHLRRIFGVSLAQASADIQTYLAEAPGALRYDLSAKAYLWTGAAQPPASPAWSEALAHLSPDHPL